MNTYQQEVLKLKKKSTVDEASNVDNAREKNSPSSAMHERRMTKRRRRRRSCNNAKERVAEEGVFSAVTFNNFLIYIFKIFKDRTTLN